MLSEAPRAGQWEGLGVTGLPQKGILPTGPGQPTGSQDPAPSPLATLLGWSSRYPAPPAPAGWVPTYQGL